MLYGLIFVLQMLVDVEFLNEVLFMGLILIHTPLAAAANDSSGVVAESAPHVSAFDCV